MDLANTNKQSIVHLIFSFSIGGAENLLIDLINEQAKFSLTHLIVVNDYYDKVLLERLSPLVKVHLLKRAVGSSNPIIVFRLNKLLVFLKPHVIHCHNNNIINLIFIFRSRTLITVHDVNMDLQDLKKYNIKVAISKCVKDDIERRSKINSPVYVVYNAINTSIIHKRVSSSKKTFRIVQVSRLVHEKKGQDILLDAFKILVSHKCFVDVQLDFIGTGESKKYLLDKIDKLELKKYVSILEDKDRSWIYSNLKNYNLIVQPSRYEGFGLTIVEGMAANIPVVASDLDGPAEILCNGKYGLLFASGDSLQLAEQLEYAIKNRNTSIMEVMTRQALNHVKTCFSLQTMVNKYSELYNVI